MSDQQPSPTSVEVPLEDIEKLLETEDPGFNQEMEAVRTVEADTNLVIEASVVADALGLEDKDAEKLNEGGLKKYLRRFKAWRLTLKARIRAGIKQFFINCLQWLKTKPIEYFFYSIAISKILLKKAMVPVVLFSRASFPQKLLAIVLLAIGVGCFVLVAANLKGIWLPQLNNPILRSLEPYADWTDTYQVTDKRESFYAAFPQEKHQFLFKKMKVNLKAGPDSPNPMGAFELIVEIDSKDTAVEVGDRQVEFHDMLQRLMEQESANDLSTEIGKNRVKNRIKKELDSKLTQGWIKDVIFKTFILKP